MRDLPRDSYDALYGVLGGAVAILLVMLLLSLVG